MGAGDYAGAAAADFAAIRALAAPLEGTGKPLITTSGTLLLALAGISGRPGTEADFASSGPRVDAENFVTARLPSAVAILTDESADGAGDAVVVWNSALGSTQAAVYGRRLSPAGTLGPAVRLGTGYLPHIAIDPAAAGLITWQSTTYQSGLVTTIYGRHVTATKGTFGSLIKFTADGEHAQIAVDQSGRSGVSWLRSSNAPLVQVRFGS